MALDDSCNIQASQNNFSTKIMQKYRLSIKNSHSDIKEGVFKVWFFFNLIEEGGVEGSRNQVTVKILV